MFRFLLRCLVGSLVGYSCYILVLCVVIYVDKKTYGYSGIDTFFALYFPLVSPHLFSPEVWSQTPLEDIHLMLIGGLLLLAGVGWANWKHIPI